jgi:hypothetical protein
MIRRYIVWRNRHTDNPAYAASSRGRTWPDAALKPYRPDAPSARQLPARPAPDEQLLGLRRKQDRQEPAHGGRMLTHPLDHRQRSWGRLGHVLCGAALGGDIQTRQVRVGRYRIVRAAPLHGR